MPWPSFEAAFALAEPLIKKSEGFSNFPYLCPTGVPTIGWGTTHYPDGRAVTLGDAPASGIEAQIYLETKCKDVIGRLLAHGVMTRVPTAHQAAALLDLGYNIGVGIHDGVKGDLADSTLLARFNAGLMQAAADQFLAWDKAHIDGQVVTLEGLKARRWSDRALFLSADAVAQAAAA